MSSSTRLGHGLRIAVQSFLIQQEGVHTSARGPIIPVNRSRGFSASRQCGYFQCAYLQNACGRDVPDEMRYCSLSAIVLVLFHMCSLGETAACCNGLRGDCRLCCCRLLSPKCLRSWLRSCSLINNPWLAWALVQYCYMLCLGIWRMQREVKINMGYRVCHPSDRMTMSLVLEPAWGS